MPEVTSEVATSEAFRQRAINILGEKCTDCFLATRVINRAGLDEGCIYEGRTAFKRLGSFLGGLPGELQPADCDGVDCLNTEQEAQLNDLLKMAQLPADPSCSEPMVELAIAEGVLPATH